jgi:H/ACA ribonucleoprotein complex subunit 4
MNERSLSELISRSVMNVDKPAGMTSNDVVVEIKKIFDLKRCGHTGTLDPNVTGVLVVALENATKAMPVLIGFDKEYEGVMYLHKDVELKKLKEIISKNFIGEIIQIPPIKSHVARKARKRKVYSFDILEKNEKNVKFRTKVESGTYIRKLCSDIGEKLGAGAQMKELRRTKVGHFTIEESHSLDEIRNAYETWKKGIETPLRNILTPIEKAILHVKKVYVKDDSISYIRNGTPVTTSDIIKVDSKIGCNEAVGIFSSDDELIAIGISKVDTEEIIDKSSKSVVRIDRVI